MPQGTAANKLRKSILFSLLKISNLNICFQCNEEIKDISELSIEHKIPWLDSENPKELFFDLNNIAFSHLSCNCASARQTKELKHPSLYSYKKGCRCKECTEIQRKSKEVYRNKVKMLPSSNG